MCVCAADAAVHIKGHVACRFSGHSSHFYVHLLALALSVASFLVTRWLGASSVEFNIRHHVHLAAPIYGVWASWGRDFEQAGRWLQFVSASGSVNLKGVGQTREWILELLKCMMHSADLKSSSLMPSRVVHKHSAAGQL
eukprot:1159854-Pelagomonas_calceolata.AAC.8